MGTRRPGLRAVAWLGAAAALAGTFSLYLRPGWVVDLGAFMAWCGLR
ncbi:MAG: hypothetical protein RJA99_4443 [Pseudomonadota bacterium]|jgi:hypothetical protein